MRTTDSGDLYFLPGYATMIASDTGVRRNFIECCAVAGGKAKVIWREAGGTVCERAEMKEDREHETESGSGNVGGRGFLGGGVSVAAAGI